MSIRERIQTAIGNYYDKHIEPKILVRLTPEQRKQFAVQPDEEILTYPFD